MDSITQAALGGALGGAVLGRRFGRGAVIAGALLVIGGFVYPHGDIGRLLA